MKNIEKYTNTKDALEAYNQPKYKNVPFDVWLEHEYKDPRVPTLLEAAEAVAHSWFDDDKNEVLCVKICALVDAIDREKRKTTRNCDVGTVAEQAERFHSFCKSNKQHGDVYSCERCRLNSIEDCELAWSQMPYEAGGAK